MLVRRYGVAGEDGDADQRLVVGDDRGGCGLQSGSDGAHRAGLRSVGAAKSGLSVSWGGRRSGITGDKRVHRSNPQTWWHYDRFARNKFGADAKGGDHFPQADFPLLIPLLLASDYFRVPTIRKLPRVTA